MTSLADNLPADIASQVHPDWRKNEAEYWTVRGQLIRQYQGQWVAFAGSTVVAVGPTPLQVFLAIQQSDDHPFVTRVGHESEPWYRIRKVTFPYDSGYPSAALPVMSIEFRSSSGTPGVMLNRVIPDTGADTTTLPWSDCQQMQLDPSTGIPGLISGVGGGQTATMGFLIWAFLDGLEYPCQLQAEFVGTERILGRDVLNSLDILFRGPSGEIVVNP